MPPWPRTPSAPPLWSWPPLRPARPAPPSPPSRPACTARSSTCSATAPTPAADRAAGSQLQRQGDQLGAGGHAELAEDIAEVEVDGARADEQLRGGVPVGQPLPDQPGDLALLRGQVGGGRDVAPARGLAGGAQLLRRPLGPRGGTELLEQGESGAQV